MMHRLVLPIVLTAAASAWASPSASQVPEKFPIYRGDNLSSISKIVFGDSHYWPKLWKDHTRILNPENSIEFLLGNEESAPSFAIAESDDDTSFQATPMITPAAAKNSSEIEIPPPTVRPKPVLKLGSIFPSWKRLESNSSSFSDYSVEVLPRKPLIAVDREFIPVYVQDEPLAPIGEYIQTASDAGLVYENEEVLLRIKSGSGQVGGHYLLLRDGGKLENGWNSPNVDHRGHIIDVLGEVVLISQEPVSEDGYDHFRARVIHAISVSVRGASVVPGEVTWVNTSPTGSTANIQAEIIGGNFDSRGMLFGEGDWVFLNRGAKDGLQEGQLIWTNTLPSNYETDTPFKVGVHHASLIKIVKVASEVSTGLILSSKQGVMQHDFSDGSTVSLNNDGKTNTGGSVGGDDLSNDLNLNEINDPGNDIGIDPGPDGDNGNDGLGGL